MPDPQKVTFITPEEYLRMEERAIVRHEYIDGRLFAMTGGTNNHSLIVGNLNSILRAHMGGSGCRVHAGMYKVHVSAMNCFYYPDIVVECEKFDGRSTSTKQPVLLAEVISRSTARGDRGEKCQAYKQLPSLQEYLIVHQFRQRAELHRRNPLGGWDLIEFGPETQVCLESISSGPLEVPIEALYEDTDIRPDSGLTVREDTADYIEDEECMDY